MGTIALGFILAETARWSQTLMEGESARREIYLGSVADDVERWYAGHLAAVDGDGPLPDPRDPGWLRQMGVVPKFGLRIQWSDLLTQGPLRFRRALLWLPSPDRELVVGVDFSGGTVVAPGSAMDYRIVDGAPLEGRAYAKSLALLQGLARDLELRAQAKWEMDPQHAADSNPFRPRDPACAAGAD